MTKAHFEPEVKLDTKLNAECTCCQDPCDAPVITFG